MRRPLRERSELNPNQSLRRSLRERSKFNPKQGLRRPLRGRSKFYPKQGLRRPLRGRSPQPSSICLKMSSLNNGHFGDQKTKMTDNIFFDNGHFGPR